MELHDLVQCGAVLIWPCQIPLECQIDEARVDLGEVLVSAAQPLHGARRVVLNHHIGGRRQSLHRRPALGPLEINRQAALATVEGGEEAGSKSAESTRVVT